jgi:hypothetical protein
VASYTGFEPQVGEIRALRTFRIGPGGGLYPLFSDTPWSDESNTARCELRHDAPGPDCSCGYYGYASEAATAEYAQSRHVLAVVAVWGKVIAGTRGLRAQHAHIEALWMSESVPDALAAEVATRYPSTSIYSDRSAMLTEHAPTVLDCYDVDAPGQRPHKTLGLRVGLLVAVFVGSLPAGWIWQHHDSRLIWVAELGFFLAGALVLRLTRRDFRDRGAALFFVAVTLWLAAPFAGIAGVVMLRLPILQIAALGLIQRMHLNRAARRFPARI